MLYKKPIVAVSCTTNGAGLTDSPARAIHNSVAYTNAVAAAGAVPVLTPECSPRDFAQLCDGLLLTGGHDVDPTWYGEDPINETVKVDLLRDSYEIELVRAFMAQQKPIMTICRGFQLMNVILGGDLYQDLNSQLGFVHMAPEVRHPFFAEPDSVLGQLFGTEFRVNSTHHQAVRTLGKGLRVTGKSIEGIIESYECVVPGQLIWGTQFHPERLTVPQWDDRTPDFAPYFAAFVEKIKERG
jgi:putative glutamine amidotransferase